MRFFPLLLVAFAACAAPTDPDRDDAATDTDALLSRGLVEVKAFGKNPGALKMFEQFPRTCPRMRPSSSCSTAA